MTRTLRTIETKHGTIKRNKLVFVSNETEFYGAKVLYVGLNHIRVHCYYDGSKPHNVPIQQVGLQDGQ